MREKREKKKNINVVFSVQRLILGEDENNYYFQTDLPSLKKDQIKIELSNDDPIHILTISGKRETIIDHLAINRNGTKKEFKNESKNEKEGINKNENETKIENDKKYSKIECNYGKFSRSFILSANINAIQAKLENDI
ncbi:hypothetical protein BCR36DRAFT_416875 [Piromyces finnis]|uniref:SHSP domain-containing protein n=1 Tax=Piromyces finnis TaxID=1754191 RepID=A0A1Y1UTH1_9FUNG|nr:hypothetical protein BCR36DRAFT_416875 [Piromyces finnis]|eukprot:ORX41329.1 hypothetical protein BCR36DRAFT_416875 [Piromyces finnis]